MSRLNKLQTNFTGGELSPRADGRSDLAKYQSGLKSLHNFLTNPIGGVYKRPGSVFIAEAMGTDRGDSFFVPFEYSNTQAYQLEFADNKIAFFKDQGQILQGRGFTNGFFDTTINGWTTRVSGTGAATYSSGTLSLVGGGAANEARAYQSLANMGISTYKVTLDITGSNTIFRVGTSVGGSEVASGSLTVGTAREFSFTCSVNSTIYIEFENAGTATVDNVVLDSPLYIIDSPYTSTQFDKIRWAQFFDILYLVHPDLPPYQLQRLGHDNWYLSQVAFDEPAYLDINLSDTTITPSATTGTGVTVTASTSIFSSTDVGRAIRYKAGPDKSEVTTYTGTGSQTYYDIPFYPQGSSDFTVSFVEASGANTAKTYTAGVPGAGQYTITNGQVRTGDTASTSQRVKLTPSNAGSGEWGWMTITGYTSGTSVTVEIEQELGGTNASKDWQLGSWSDTTGYPSQVCIHEQRLWFAASSTQPEYFWGSATADYTNFQPDNALRKGSVDSDTAVTFAVSGTGGKKIVWLASKQALLIGTQSGVHSAKGSNGAITATNITVRVETSSPCEDARIVETETEVIFIERLGYSVRALYYSFNDDGFISDDLNMVAEHIGRTSKIRKITFQDDKRVLWVIREDGSLVSTTYFRGQQVNSWQQHTLGGTDVFVDSVSAISGSDYSETWMLVNRTVNGGNVRYIEVLSKEFFLNDLADAVFLDCSLTYEGTSATVITGLSYLEGQAVSILNNGSPESAKVVSGGQITLDKATTKCTIGLGYTAYLQTLDIEGGSVIGTSQSQIARIIELSLRVFETVSLELGSSSSNYDSVQFRMSSDLMDTAVPLFSGFKSLKFPKGYDNHYTAYVQSSDPLPCTILSMIFKVQVADA